MKNQEHSPLYMSEKKPVGCYNQGHKENVKITDFLLQHLIYFSILLTLTNIINFSIATINFNF
jgi:hypothetical protein